MDRVECAVYDCHVLYCSAVQLWRSIDLVASETTGWAKKNSRNILIKPQHFTLKGFEDYDVLKNVQLGPPCIVLRPASATAWRGNVSSDV